jgi:hypothetical protein
MFTIEHFIRTNKNGIFMFNTPHCKPNRNATFIQISSLLLLLCTTQGCTPFPDYWEQDQTIESEWEIEQRDAISMTATLPMIKHRYNGVLTSVSFTCWHNQTAPISKTESGETLQFSFIPPGRYKLDNYDTLRFNDKSVSLDSDIWTISNNYPYKWKMGSSKGARTTIENFFQYESSLSFMFSNDKQSTPIINVVANNPEALKEFHELCIERSTDFYEKILAAKKAQEKEEKREKELFQSAFKAKGIKSAFPFKVTTSSIVSRIKDGSLAKNGAIMLKGRLLNGYSNGTKHYKDAAEPYKMSQPIDGGYMFRSDWDNYTIPLIIYTDKTCFEGQSLFHCFGESILQFKEVSSYTTVIGASKQMIVLKAL